MRYPQGGGGLSAERRAFRERLRLRAAQRFAAGESSTAIARDLRISVRSVQRWRHDWKAGGEQALRSAGPAVLPRLSPAQFAALEAEPRKGPLAHGWDDQRWTWPDQDADRAALPPVLHPARRAQAAGPQRVEPAGAGPPRSRTRPGRGDRLGEGDPAAGGRTAAALGSWIVFEDEAGMSMTPPIARTWAPRGHTPTITVHGRSRRRISIAALACYRPGTRSRLIYRPRIDPRPDGRKSFAWTDYRDLLIAAHRQLGAPIVLIWDNLNTHWTAGMRAFIAQSEWLTVIQLPAYAPEPNPVEGIWSILRRRFLADIASTGPGHLVATARRGLRMIQHRSDLIDGCLTGTGLTLTAK